MCQWFKSNRHTNDVEMKDQRKHAFGNLWDLKRVKDGKCMHMLTFLDMFTVLAPVEFKSVNINFWCCLTNSMELIISIKTLINFGVVCMLFQSCLNILIRLGRFGHVQKWKKIEFPKEYFIWIWKQQCWEVYQEIDDNMKWGRIEEQWVEKGDRKKYITERNERSSWKRQGIDILCTCQWNEWILIGFLHILATHLKSVTLHYNAAAQI
jgi:hypothetical protein